MTTNWFVCQVKFEKILETGTAKKVSESYLVDAMSFAEAEARTIEEVTPFISGEFEVTVAKKARIAELFTDNSSDRYYLAKVAFISLDEKSGTEKKSYSTMIIQANNFEEALKNLQTGMKGTMSDWEVYSITESKILDIFRSNASKED